VEPATKKWCLFLSDVRRPPDLSLFFFSWGGEELFATPCVIFFCLFSSRLEQIAEGSFFPAPDAGFFLPSPPETLGGFCFFFLF